MALGGHTSNYGAVSRQPGSIRLESSGTANEPGVLQTDSVVAAGTTTVHHVWIDSSGRLRHATSYPSDEDGSGFAYDEKHVSWVNSALLGSIDISARPIFAPEGAAATSTFSLVRGSIVTQGVVNVISGQTLSLGLTSPAGTIVTLNRTSSIAAGTRVSLGTFSNTSLNTGQVVRFFVTQPAAGTLNTGLAWNLVYRQRS